MRILCVGNWSSDTGYAWWLMERFWEGIARKYPDRVTISFPNVNGISQRLTESGANIVEHAFDPRSLNTAAWVREQGFKHLYLTDQPYNCSGYGRLRRAGVERIIVHDHTPGERSTARGLNRLAKTLIARYEPWNADAYIAVSDYVRQRFLQCVCLPASKCHVAQNGIDLDIEADPTDIRAELGLPADATVVVSVSRATNYKRVHHIIEAAASVKNAYFIHCGDGPDLAEFRDLIARLGLERRFFLLGKRSDVAGILAAADIGVHASEGEVGTSLSILEFMRAGLPVVAPNSPSVAQSIDHMYSGLLYPPGDISQLAKYLNAFVDMKSFRLTMGQYAQRKVQKYDINHTVSAVLNVFSSVGV